MARYKDPDSWSYGGVKRRDFRADHGTNEVPPYRKKKGKKSKPRKGCPENNNKQHVYLNVPKEEYYVHPRTDGKFVLVTWKMTQVKCCGCGHVKNTIWDHKGSERKVVDKIPRWYWQF